MAIVKTLPINLSRIVALLQQKAWSLAELADHLQLTKAELRNDLAYLGWINLPVQQPLMLLDANKITNTLHENIKNLIAEITILEAIPSTNEFLRQAAPVSGINICLAEMQTQGKARTGKNWLSPFGLNIYLSFAASYEGNIKHLSGVSLVFALSMVKVIKQIVGEKLASGIKVKWPNDLLIYGKKLTGILVETIQQKSTICLVAGIGLNVNMIDDVDDNLNNIYSSLHLVSHKIYDRNEIVAAMLQQLILDWQKFKEFGLLSFLSEWHSFDILYNQVISLNYGNQQIFGIAKGIDEHGYLILQDREGRIHQYAQGEVSLVRLASVE